MYIHTCIGMCKYSYVYTWTYTDTWVHMYTNTYTALRGDITNIPYRYKDTRAHECTDTTPHVHWHIYIRVVHMHTQSHGYTCRHVNM